MKSQPLVSVIIPFLNAEKCFQETIESVLAQTYDNWELLLIDDGSTDKSTAIAQQYATEHPQKVLYVEHDNHQNRGASASRNVGISKSKGKYVAFLDADDVWLPQKLEQQVAILESHPEAGMVYGRTQYWQSWTGNPEDANRDYQPELGVQTDTLFKPPTLLTQCYPLGKAAAPCPSDLLTRREMLERTGGFEEDFRGVYQLYEDQTFLVKVYLKESVFVASECWLKYRLHPDSCSSNVAKVGQYHTVRLFFLNWLADYLSQQKVKNTEIRRSLQKALLPYRYPLLYKLAKSANNQKTQMKQTLKLIARKTLPASVHRWIGTQMQGDRYIPPVGAVDLGSLRRVTPISRIFGYDRGQPIDRYYIENFLAHHQNDIRGRVLEIGDDSYTQQFGSDHVTQRDVLHVKEGNPKATFIGDLTNADNVPSDSFDCFVLTQTIHLIYDVRVALQTVYRILKPGGVALITVPGTISQLAIDEWGAYWCWGFTSLSIRRLFEEVFPAENLQIETYGNVLTATAFLQGLASQELRSEELDHRDPSYQVILTIRAVKPEQTT